MEKCVTHTGLMLLFGSVGLTPKRIPTKTPPCLVPESAGSTVRLHPPNGSHPTPVLSNCLFDTQVFFANVLRLKRFQAATPPTNTLDEITFRSYLLMTSDFKRSFADFALHNPRQDRVAEENCTFSFPYFIAIARLRLAFAE